MYDGIHYRISFSCSQGKSLDSEEIVSDIEYADSEEQYR